MDISVEAMAWWNALSTPDKKRWWKHAGYDVTPLRQARQNPGMIEMAYDFAVNA